MAGGGVPADGIGEGGSEPEDVSPPGGLDGPLGLEPIGGLAELLVTGVKPSLDGSMGDPAEGVTTGAALTGAKGPAAAPPGIAPPVAIGAGAPGASGLTVPGVNPEGGSTVVPAGRGLVPVLPRCTVGSEILPLEEIIPLSPAASPEVRFPMPSVPPDDETVLPEPALPDDEGEPPDAV